MTYTAIQRCWCLLLLLLGIFHGGYPACFDDVVNSRVCMSSRPEESLRILLDWNSFIGHNRSSIVLSCSLASPYRQCVIDYISRCQIEEGDKTTALFSHRGILEATEHICENRLDEFLPLSQCLVSRLEDKQEDRHSCFIYTEHLNSNTSNAEQCNSYNGYFYCMEDFIGKKCGHQLAQEFIKIRGMTEKYVLQHIECVGYWENPDDTGILSRVVRRAKSSGGKSGSSSGSKSSGGGSSGSSGGSSSSGGSGTSGGTNRSGSGNSNNSGGRNSTSSMPVIHSAFVIWISVYIVYAVIR